LVDREPPRKCDLLRREQTYDPAIHYVDATIAKIIPEE